jgi:hypothetical protein
LSLLSEATTYTILGFAAVTPIANLFLEVEENPDELFCHVFPASFVLKNVPPEHAYNVFVSPGLYCMSFMFILVDFSVQLLPLLYEKYTPPEVAATIVLRFKGFTMSLFTVTLPELAIPVFEAVKVSPPSVD